MVSFKEQLCARVPSRSNNIPKCRDNAMKTGVCPGLNDRITCWLCVCVSAHLSENMVQIENKLKKVSTDRTLDVLLWKETKRHEG